MKLADIFEQGHRIAVETSENRIVVRCLQDGGDEGNWLIASDALPRVAYRKKVDPDDLKGLVSAADRSNEGWTVDTGNCWCDTCTTSRKMLETHDE